MIFCVFISAMTSVVSLMVGIASWANIGDGPRNALLTLAAVSAMVAVGSLEAFEAQGPSKKDEK